MSPTRQSPAARRAPGLDWILMAASMALVALGSLLVWSATSHRDGLTDGDPTTYLKKQLVNVAIGIVLMVMVLATDHRWVRIVAPLIYFASVIGLVLVLVMGSTINGSRSWLMLGGMSIQPSEFAKLAVVIGMALLVAERSEGSWRRKVGTGDVVGMLAIAAVPAALILLQPDLGTMLVLTATVFGVLAISGAPRRWLAGLLGAGVVVAWVAVAAGFLKDYQIDRFMAFTNPELDPRGAGYNVEQARIAIGNGGVFGQGLFDGSQTRSGFVPEQHTDFIFTVAGEEFGLVGAGVLIALLGVVVWRSLAIAMHSEDMFGRVAAAGIACWIGFQAFQNIGMCLGIMPVTGVPLPFVSYGGSSMFAGMLALGLLQNIHLRSTASLPTRFVTPRSLVSR
ncbi:MULTISPECIES: rod shape-determining protein RodA [unclassified Nocardioides]|uniref:rod shape-determining protein RodA n=1 Tax=unclassified Nocardioides TaxID=2615069 RepID=UPI0006F5EC78|nr:MULTISPECIES: rod shape-determining protein RodA [unclassified Nocardioides]KQY63678.1 rod shape-determining protein RodA [Nocardioides sp. Root140]KQZ67576.1 rod shape-determining protein RodA [Nocardioides sp. Root151]KRF15694.1 rod shape-determining protein RodA [Nocardioides sp. Soil796]